MAETEIYQLAQWTFEDKEVIADKAKVTRKQSTEDYTASNSFNPYATVITEESVDFELSDVSPDDNSWKMFHEQMDKQKESTTDLPMCSLYGHNLNGDLTPRAILYGCTVTEISEENTTPFSVKGSAQRIKVL